MIKASFCLVMMAFLVGRLSAQQIQPNSSTWQNPRLPLEVNEAPKEKKSTSMRFSGKAARKAFGKRQRRGKSVFRQFEWELDQKKMEYHKSMIHQIRQYRKLQRKMWRRKNASPINGCFAPGKGRIRKFWMF